MIFGHGDGREGAECTAEKGGHRSHGGGWTARQQRLVAADRGRRGEVPVDEGQPPSIEKRAGEARCTVDKWN